MIPWSCHTLALHQLIYCVYQESFLLQELLFALSTLEWFFTSVNPFILVQIAQYPEGLVTLWHCFCLATVFIMKIFDHKKYFLHPFSQKTYLECHPDFELFQKYSCIVVLWNHTTNLSDHPRCNVHTLVHLCSNKLGNRHPLFGTLV